MAEKKKKIEAFEEPTPQELEAIANDILNEGADALDIEPFTLIELPPEGSKKKGKKSAKGKGRQADADIASTRTTSCPPLTTTPSPTSVSWRISRSPPRRR